MSHDDLERALRRTSEDSHVSRGERKALRALLEEQRPDAHVRNLLRNQAFQIAREGCDGRPAGPWLSWLEDVVGLLVDVGSAPEPRQEAGVGAWFGPGTDPLLAVIAEMRRVRSSADICVFTITDDRLSDGLIGLARRGVRVRVLSDNDKAQDRGSDLGRLAAAGIDVGFDDTPAHMHHKFAVFDDTRLLTGSFNWTRSATEENHENVLVTTNPTLVGLYGAEFQRLWARFG